MSKKSRHRYPNFIINKKTKDQLWSLNAAQPVDNIMFKIGRRKMIKNTLKNSYTNISNIMKICNIPENSRPENINLQQFCNLTKEIDRLNAYRF